MGHGFQEVCAGTLVQRLLGRASGARGPTRWARREPHSTAPHGHATRTVTLRDSPNRRAAGAGATKEPRPEKLPAEEGGRVRARAAVAGVSVCLCVCVSVCVCEGECACVRAAADTGGPGFRVSAAGSGGRGGGSRTRQGTPRAAHPVPPYGRSFFG